MKKEWNMNEIALLAHVPGIDDMMKVTVDGGDVINKFGNFDNMSKNIMWHSLAVVKCKWVESMTDGVCKSYARWYFRDLEDPWIVYSIMPLGRKSWLIGNICDIFDFENDEHESSFREHGCLLVFSIVKYGNANECCDREMFDNASKRFFENYVKLGYIKYIDPNSDTDVIESEDAFTPIECHLVNEKTALNCRRLMKLGK